jgi:hypothetical protein
MPKQTAVEWLLEQCPRINTVASLDVIDQAIAMEKEQIEEAFVSGSHFEYEFQNSKNYYNETYEGGHNE